jgi:hypothetical protein
VNKNVGLVCDWQKMYLAVDAIDSELADSEPAAIDRLVRTAQMATSSTRVGVIFRAWKVEVLQPKSRRCQIEET